MKAQSLLAQQGGKPVRSEWLPYGRQDINDDDIRAVEAVLRGDIITRGPAVRAFEDAIGKAVGANRVVAFASGTAALHAVMAMCGVGPGKKVVTSPITFAATANAVRYCGGEVVFSDIDPLTMNLDPHTLDSLNEVTVVAPVDFAGNPCDYDEFRKHHKGGKFRLMADAAHSFGGFYKGRPVGTLCELSILSFHPVKSMTTAEGGAVLTQNPDEAKFLRAFKDHGIQRTDIPGFYKQEFLGFHYHMTDLQAALGLSQMKRLPSFIKRRQEIADQYTKFFSSIAEVQTPSLTEGARSAWHLYPLRLSLEKPRVDRTEFLRALHAENIGANVHYIPVYWRPYYERLGYKKGLCPIAEREYLREISLPIFPSMTEQDIRDVCHAIEKLVTFYSV